MSKLDGIKAGDRVRIGLEGTVSETGDYLSVTLDGWRVPSRLYNSAVDAPTFQITRIDPPLKIGDRVVSVLRSGGLADDDRPMELVAFLKDGRIVVEYPAGDNTNVIARDPSCFARA